MTLGPNSTLQHEGFCLELGLAALPSLMPGVIYDLLFCYSILSR